jgi:hypothetical protein
LHNPLDADTSRGPDWWFHARDINEIRGSLELDIKKLNRRGKRSRRSLRSASIKDAVLKRQQQLTTGRIRQALASLLGKQRSSFLYDTLLCVDGSSDADPVEIHRRIQSHYMKYFSADPESQIQRLGLDLPDLGSTDRWKFFLDNPEVIVEAFLHPSGDLRPTVIPEEFVLAVSKAFQRSPAAISLEVPPLRTRSPSKSSYLQLKVAATRFQVNRG